MLAYLWFRRSVKWLSYRKGHITSKISTQIKLLDTCNAYRLCRGGSLVFATLKVQQLAQLKFLWLTENKVTAIGLIIGGLFIACETVAYTIQLATFPGYYDWNGITW